MFEIVILPEVCCTASILGIPPERWAGWDWREDRELVCDGTGEEDPAAVWDAQPFVRCTMRGGKNRAQQGNAPSGVMLSESSTSTTVPTMPGTSRAQAPNAWAYESPQR